MQATAIDRVRNPIQSSFGRSSRGGNIQYLQTKLQHAHQHATGPPQKREKRSRTPARRDAAPPHAAKRAARTPDVAPPRHPFPATTPRANPTPLTRILPAHETFTRKSAKPSTPLLRRAPRKRRSNTNKPLPTDAHHRVPIARHRSRATTHQTLPDPQTRTFTARLAPIVANHAVLVSDTRDAYRAFAHTENIPHIPIITSRL